MWMNETFHEFPRDNCVQQLVARQAAATPDAVALVMGDWFMTYGELNRRANQLAHHLRLLGVGPNVLVGVYMERSLDLIVALLGILKAGGAYVPLDHSYPTERLTFMLQDARTPVLLTHQHLVEHLSLDDIQVLCLDSDAATFAAYETADPAVVNTISDLVYVIYTSGSTGHPKGVEITHESLLNLVFWHQRAFSVTASDRATQLASPAFDATGWEVWPYLTRGASVYLPDEETRLSSQLLRDWLILHGITITFLPTAMAESAVALEWPETTALRIMLTGADKLQHYPPVSLPFAFVNNYGPTESTVVVTSGLIAPVDYAESPPSIGRPIDNTQVYILDEDLRKVSSGEPGELYIGGTGLARGYLNRPDLTRERFIAHSFADEPAVRLYKTGDLVRMLPDGQILFLGRTDHQIKIRGYRIEPDEIVTALNRQPLVQASVVVAREDPPLEKRLVAYVVLEPGAPVTATALREPLALSLPDYMVPSAFVRLAALPITPNGKVDRTALPVPDASNMLPDDLSVSPATPTEERVEAIVASLLGIKQISVEDNFFLLGGHSLLGTQVIARVSDTFGVQLSLRALFDAPSVRLLSAEIEKRIIAKLEVMSEEEAMLLLDQLDRVGSTSI
jgi:amino acid adenylation domain-containing protein